MSKVKATKVPVMRKGQRYQDWKKELQIWQAANEELGVKGKVQACVLFESLDGTPRETILSELEVSDVTTDNGVENIINTLDNYFLGNETQNAYNAIDNLYKYKRDKSLSVEDFIIEFKIKVNKIKQSGTILPDGVLGYTLLNCANLPEDKHDMVKATCDVLNFKNVKAQLEKIGLGKSSTKSGKYSAVPEPDDFKVKVESCLYNARPSNYHRNFSDSSSEEDLNGTKMYFGKSRFNYSKQNVNKEFKLNPNDRFGHTSVCTNCHCIYHWLIDCPYASPDIKAKLSKRVSNNSNPSNKTL